MGWAFCGYDSKGRPIGYSIAARCDEEGCKANIDRGLAYACGNMHGNEDSEGRECCDGYFCEEHRLGGYCARCGVERLADSFEELCTTTTETPELDALHRSLREGGPLRESSKLDWRDSKPLTAREGMIIQMARHKRSALTELVNDGTTFTDNEQKLIDAELAKAPCEKCGGDDWYCS